MNPNDIDILGRTKLHLAAKRGYVELAEALIVNGADINRKDKYSCTPLCLAEYYGQDKVAALLKKHGAKL